jgi:hypothetical protein
VGFRQATQVAPTSALKRLGNARHISTQHLKGTCGNYDEEDLGCGTKDSGLQLLAAGNLSAKQEGLWVLPFAADFE